MKRTLKQQASIGLGVALAGALAFGTAPAMAQTVKMAVPTFLVGFSLGALLGVDLWASNPEVRFDRSLLFAPAESIQTEDDPGDEE